MSPDAPSLIQPQGSASPEYPFHAGQMVLTGLLVGDGSSLVHVPMTNTGSVACRATAMLALLDS